VVIRAILVVYRTLPKTGAVVQSFAGFVQAGLIAAKSFGVDSMIMPRWTVYAGDYRRPRSLMSVRLRAL